MKNLNLYYNCDCSVTNASNTCSWPSTPFDDIFFRYSNNYSRSFVMTVSGPRAAHHEMRCAPRAALHALRSTRCAPRAALHALRPTRCAPRAALHGPRSMCRAPRAALHTHTLYIEQLHTDSSCVVKCTIIIPRRRTRHRNKTRPMVDHREVRSDQGKRLETPHQNRT